MSARNSWISPIISAFFLVLAIIGWIFLTPQDLGGQTTYVVLMGNSMEPGFRQDDLVLVLPSTSYEVNDIVAYEQPDIGTVFHRITQIQNNKYVLKGDNNSWEDSYHPLKNEIIGKLWVHVPNAGEFLRFLRTPGGFSIVVTGFVIFIFFSLFSENLISAKSKSHSATITSKFQSIKENNSMDKKGSDALYIISSVGFMAIVLAIASFSKPIESSAQEEFNFTQFGHFEYSSPVPDDIYDEHILKSGDPIYRQINDSFDVDFTYELKSERRIRNIQGTYRMQAIIKEASGWERSIELTAPSLISVKKFRSTAQVDLDKIQSLVDNFEEQTGVTNNRYTLTIQPEIIIAGNIENLKMEDSFTPGLNFSFDDEKLIFLKGNDISVDVLNPVQESTVVGPYETANTLSVLGFKLNVLVARMISIYGILGCIFALLYVFYKNRQGKLKIVDEQNTK